jgi:hypothetical protein
VASFDPERLARQILQELPRRRPLQNKRLQNRASFDVEASVIIATITREFLEAPCFF